MRWLAVVMVLALGCEAEPVTLAIDLRTDLAPGDEIDRVTLALSGEGEPMELETRADAQEDYVAGARLAELEVTPGDYVLVATLFDPSGEEVVQQRISIDLGADRVVTVLLARSCRTVSCGEGETCVGGLCEPVGCTPETPEACAQIPVCSTDGECPDPGGCLRASCVAGTCMASVDPAACAPEERCDPISGCQPRSTDPACEPTPDADTLALYTFDDPTAGSVLRDQTADHDGVVREDQTAIVASRDGCGLALGVGANEAETIPPAEIASSPAWELTEGSVDLWVRHEGRAVIRGLLSRDANRVELPGHFSILLMPDHRVWARVQLDPMVEERVCTSSALTAGQWHHLGVNFGPPGLEVWLDGVSERGDGEFVFSDRTTLDCSSEPIGLGLSGNGQPWGIGAGLLSAEDGAATPARDYFVDGAIDQLRISSARRDFGAP